MSSGPIQRSSSSPPSSIQRSEPQPTDTAPADAKPADVARAKPEPPHTEAMKRVLFGAAGVTGGLYTQAKHEAPTSNAATYSVPPSLARSKPADEPGPAGTADATKAAGAPPADAAGFIQRGAEMVKSGAASALDRLFSPLQSIADGVKDAWNLVHSKG